LRGRAAGRCARRGRAGRRPRGENPRPMRPLRILTAVVLAAALVPASGCGGPDEEAGPPVKPIMPVAVHLEPVVNEEVRQRVELTGVVEARRETTVSAEVSGLVEEVFVDDGEGVAAGEPLVRLRRLPTELQLRQAEGLLGAARAELAKKAGGYRPEEIRQAAARAESAAAEFERWRQEHERTKRLLAEGASFEAEMEVVQASYERAEQQLAEARAALDLMRTGYQQEDIEKARGEVAAQEATVGELRDRLAKMTVAMPFDGYVVRRRSEVGEWLTPGSPVAEVVDLGVVRVLVDVPERYAAGVSVGDEARVVLAALGDREFVGKVTAVVPASSAGSHTVPVRVDVANTESGGRPVISAGLFARVWLSVGVPHRGVLVPKSAVIRQGEADLVYMVTDEAPAELAASLKAMAAMGALSPPGTPRLQFARAIRVRLVQGYGRYMEVASEGLEAGVRVITRGTYLMQPGTPVRAYAKEGAGAASEAASGETAGEAG